MNIQEISDLYAKSPQVAALAKLLEDKSVATVFLQGLVASAAPMMFAAVARRVSPMCLFVLNDAEEAGYFYHDLTQIMGNTDVLFFPSSYRRQIKYGQRDPASEILRTEVLSRLSAPLEGHPLYVVTCPEALSELVVSRKKLDERTLLLRTGDTHDVIQLEKTLRDFGFTEVDYVYEPGQFALRGSILDVFSYSSEYPFRIDFFGDEIDSIRTFEVQSQLSRDKRERIEIVPELATLTDEKVSFMRFLPEDTIIVAKDLMYVRDVIDRTYQDGFSSQAQKERLEGLTEMEQQAVLKEMRADASLINGARFMADASGFRRIDMGVKPVGTPSSTLKFDITPQPLFHKNFDLLTKALEDYMLRGYKLYILADSTKQNERLKEIFTTLADEGKAGRIEFVPVDKTLHEGFADNSMPACFFTDHQIFDRFHKYSLRSDAARSGKMALTMKELQEMEPGDYIVHVDFGIGRFAGLVRVPAGNSYQEMIRIIIRITTRWMLASTLYIKFLNINAATARLRRA